MVNTKNGKNCSGQDFGKLMFHEPQSFWLVSTKWEERGRIKWAKMATGGGGQSGQICIVWGVAAGTMWQCGPKSIQPPSQHNNCKNYHSQKKNKKIRNDISILLDSPNEIWKLCIETWNDPSIAFFVPHHQKPNGSCQSHTTPQKIKPR